MSAVNYQCVCHLCTVIQSVSQVVSVVSFILICQYVIPVMAITVPVLMVLLLFLGRMSVPGMWSKVVEGVTIQGYCE